MEIRLRQDIRATRDRVWHCLLSAGARLQWWPQLRVLEGRPGGVMEEVWRDADGNTKRTCGRILRASPPAVLEMTWADEDWSVETEVAMRFDDHGGSTRLSLTHGGWEQFSGAEAKPLVAAHAAGWERHVGRLKAFAEAFDG